MGRTPPRIHEHLIVKVEPMCQDIFTQELEVQRTNGARIIDVREPEEYAASHIPGLNLGVATLLDFSMLQERR